MSFSFLRSSLQGSEAILATVLRRNLTNKFDYYQDNYFVMDGLEESFKNPAVPNSTSDLIRVATVNDTANGNVTNTHSLSPADNFLSSPIMMTMSCLILKYVIIPWLLLLFVCMLWEEYCVNQRDKSSSLPLPKGRMGFPVIGEMFHFLFLGVSVQRARRKEFGQIYRTHLFGRPTIRVSGEKYIKKLLLGEGHLVETKWPYTTQVILGSDGIVNGSQATHTIIKRLALRALSPRFMETYAPSVQMSVRKHVADWNRRGEVYILEECKQLIARTMMTVLLGIKEDDPDIQKYISSADDIINSILCIPIDVPFSAWRRGKRAREFIFDQMKTRLKAKMECSDKELFGQSGLSYPTSGVDEIAATSGGRDCVLVNIIKIARLEGETEIRLKNLQNLSLEIIFAGTQSLQSSSSLLILHLSQNPEVLERIREEIGENNLWDTPLDEIPYKKVNALSYTSHVVNEVLRVTPPIPGAIRLAKKTFDLDGYQVPKGWQVMFSIRETHEIAAGREKPLTAVHLPFDPSYFACEKCDPGKSSSNTEQQYEAPLTPDHICHNTNGPFSFVPFGRGRRMCAGVNYALFVLRVLAIEVARSSEFHPVTPVKLISIPMTKPTRSVKVRFSERTQPCRKAQPR